MRAVGRVLQVAGLALMVIGLVLLSAEFQTTPPARADEAAKFYRAVQRQQYAKAVNHGRAYLASHPADNSFAIDLAYAELNVGRYADVRRTLLQRETYVRTHPVAAKLWLDLSYKEAASGGTLPAIDDIDQYLRLQPNDAAAWKQRGYYVAAVTPAPLTLSERFYQAQHDKRYAEAISYGKRYLASDPNNDAFAVDLGYAYIANGNPDEAAAIADRRSAYLRSHPDAAQLLAALFYAYQTLHRLDEALSFGERYLAINPNDDKFAMDVAYADLTLGRVDRARAIVLPRQAYLLAHPGAASIWMDISYKDGDRKDYRRAISDVDAYLAFRPNDAPARYQRSLYQYNLWGGPRLAVYGYGQYEGRFADTFYGTDLTYTLAPAAVVQPYAALHLVGDTRSGAPGSPQIYSDNSLAADLGLRTQLGKNANAFVEGGVGIGLRGQGTITDLRYGLNYYQAWGTIAKQPETEAGVTGAFYSRYNDNFIVYYNMLHRLGGKGIRPFVGINGGLDSQRVFGNNYVEAQFGVEVGSPALTLRLMQVQGAYLTRGAKIPQTSYSTFRGMLVFGVAQ